MSISVNTSRNYLHICAAVVWSFYFIFIFTPYGNPSHSSEISGRLVAMLAVISTYGCLERSRASTQKAVWAALAVIPFFTWASILYSVAMRALGISS
jgi:hypothetical protein